MKGSICVVLLARCFVWAHCLSGDATKHEIATGPCVTSEEGASCDLKAVHLNTAEPLKLELSVGQRLYISPQQFSGDTVCNWTNGLELKQAHDGNSSLLIPKLSEKDSGDYVLGCEKINGTNASITVSLRVRPLKHPTNTRLRLISRGVGYSPWLQCVSEAHPRPVIQWFSLTSGKERPEHTNQHEMSSRIFPTTGVLCCAKNNLGEECSQLYDYDLDRDGRTDETPALNVSTGQSLLLRCRMTGKKVFWSRDSTVFESNPNNCINTQFCSMRDSIEGRSMFYLFITSVHRNHSGTYICNGSNKSKSVHIQVTDQEFITVHVNNGTTMSSQDAPSCLRANISSHPPLQRCTWEGPDGSKTPCPRSSRLWGNRTLELCHQNLSGEYILHLEVGALSEKKTMPLCVQGKNRVRLERNQDNVSCETYSILPANITWRVCPMSNTSCSSWEEIPGSYQQDYDSPHFCQRRVVNYLPHTVENQRCQCCIKNILTSWCSDKDVFQGSLTRTQQMIQIPAPGSSPMLMVCTLVLFVALVIITFALIHYVRKKKPHYQSQMQMIQMIGPNDNDYVYINFKDFQYDRKWEFPRENLELGKELGSGAFGMVVQAKAYGISKPGESLEVAVKMLKEKHQRVEKEALITELKMVTHVGHHANVVNLLGACTDLEPTYLIFQYCCYGDLQNYLKNNRERYHKSLTDAFGKECFSSLYHNLQPNKMSSEFQRSMDNYVPMLPVATSVGQESQTLLNCSPMELSEGQEIYEEAEEQEKELQALTYDDLLSFAYQVAKGMEFLASKNCIHRDLAARNVFVTKERLVKIGDFGLARDIDNDSNYVVKGNVRLPMKWMAPESIFQGIYTMQSDVWAYGILLWEIFSLGVTPYPGVKVDSSFYAMIERGVKMERPYYACDSVYRIMCKCWALKPCDRPSSFKLVAFMEDELTDMEEKFYHNIIDKSSKDSLHPMAPA